MFKLLLFIYLIIINNIGTFESSKIENSSNKKSTDEREELLDYMSEVGDEPGEVRLIGKWRKNGDAIEPKWRDGDTVPLVPFDAVKESPLHQRPFSTTENKTDARKLRQRIRRLRPGSVKRVQYPNLEKPDENNNSFQVNPHEHELTDELNEYQKPRPRKRRPPQNYEYPPLSPITIPQFKNLNREKTSENTELKSLLKMQEFEGLSLSEILQAKNLSLSDLLRGKTNALSALKIPEESPKIREESSKIQKKLPEIPEEFPKENIENITIKNVDENFTERPKRGRISQIKIDGVRVGGNVRRKFEGGLRRRLGNFTRLRPIVVETTTILLDPVEESQDEEEKKIIVTTTSEGKPLEDDEMLEFSDFIDKNKRNVTKNVEQVLRVGKDEDSTLSIEKVAFGRDGETVTDEKFSETVKKSGKVDKKSSEIDRISGLNETNSVGFDDLDVNNSKSNGKYLKNEEEASKLEEITSKIDEKLIKPEKIAEITTIKNELTTLTETETTTEEPEPKNHQGLPPSNRVYEKIISEIEPEAREEILDLFENSKNTDILKKLLESRNMSIDELISLRQRGSSRVHLAQVTPTRKIIPRPPPLKPFLYFNLTTKTTTEKPEKSSPIIIDLSPKNHDKFQRKNYEKESMELVDILSAFESLPFSIKKILSIENGTETKIMENIEAKNDGGDLNIVEENFFDVDDEMTTTFKLPNDFESFDDNKQKIIDKIKPSIYASIGILVMTIIGFFGIFIIFKIRQKQKYIYSNAFSRGVFHTPVINPRKLSNTSSLNTIMVNVVTTTGVSGKKFGDNNCRREMQETNRSFDGDYECRSDIDNDSLDANDSWDTIPDFMK